MNTSNPAGRYPPPGPGTGPTRKRSAGSSQACSPEAREQLRGAHVEVAREHRAGAVENQSAVACEARRPDLVGERSGGRAPGAADRREAGVRRRCAERAAEDRADVLEAAHPGIIPDAPARRRRGSTRSQASPELMGVRGGDEHLPARPQQSEQALRAPEVELAGDVVEQQQRPHAAHLAHEIGLGREQRQHGRALLALRAVAAQVALALRERELVVMRARRRAAALDVAGAARLQLGQLTRLVLGPARLVAQLDGLLELADRREMLARTARAAPRRGGRARGGSRLPAGPAAPPRAAARRGRAAPARNRRSSWLRCCSAPA